MSQVKERPILFSAPMVRAILEGRKTVTRRPVKSFQIPVEDSSVAAGERHRCMAIVQRDPRYSFGVFGATEAECAKELEEFAPSPYDRRGERLWVRETFIDLRGTCVEHRPEPDGPLHRYAYAADCRPGSHSDEARKDFGLKYKPSLHMPRAACRILLEITDVRVERLQDISEDQAKAEGCFFTDCGKACFHGGRGVRDATECEYPASKHQQRPGWMWEKTTSHEQCLDSARNAFGNLWQSVGGDWSANPVGLGGRVQAGDAMIATLWFAYVFI